MIARIWFHYTYMIHIYVYTDIWYTYMSPICDEMEILVSLTTRKPHTELFTSILNLPYKQEPRSFFDSKHTRVNTTRSCECVRIFVFVTFVGVTLTKLGESLSLTARPKSKVLQIWGLLSWKFVCDVKFFAFEVYVIPLCIYNIYFFNLCSFQT